MKTRRTSIGVALAAGIGASAELPGARGVLRRKFRASLLAMALAGTGLCGARQAMAGVVTWDGGNTGGSPQDLWSQAGNWSGSGPPLNDATTQIVMNGTVRQTNEVDANYTINSLTFNNGGFDLLSRGGGDLTFAGAGAGITNVGSNTIETNVTLAAASLWTSSTSGLLTVNGTSVSLGSFLLTLSGAGNFKIAAAIGGEGSLTMSGTGLLTLSGANDYAGATTVNSGVVQMGVNSVGSVGAITSGAVGRGTLILNGGTLSSDGGSARTILNPVTLGGDVTLGDAINNGGLTFAAAATLTGTRQLTIASATTFGGAIGDGGNGFGITKTGAGVLTLGTINTFAGTTTISAGSVLLNNASALQSSTVLVGLTNGLSFASGIGTFSIGGLSGSSNVALNNVTTLIIGNNNASTTYSGVLSGAGGINKTGTGTLTLSGASSYTGATAVSRGVLSVSTVAGASSNIGNASAGAVALGDASNPGVIFYNGTNVTFARGLTVNAGGGELDVTNASVSVTIGSNSIATTGTITLGGAGNFILNNVTGGAISGGGSVIKTGTGVLTLNGSSSFSGGLLLKAGTLKFGGTNFAGSGAITLGDSSGNTPVVLDASVLTTQVNAEVWNQDFTFSGSQGLTLGSVAGGITLAGNRQVTVTNNTLTIQGSITGTGRGITKLGGGTLALAAANSFTGTTVLSTGTLYVTDAQGLGGSGAGLSQAGGTTLVLLVDAGINAAYNTSITGSGNAVIIANRGSTNASVSHTLGTLSIANQTLALVQGSNVSTTAQLTFGDTTMSGTPVFDTGTGSVLTLGTLIGNSPFTKQGGGSLVLSSASSRTGGDATITGGTVVLNSPSALGTTDVGVVMGGATLDLATDATVSPYNATINGDTTIISDRKSSGPGITHALGTLSIGANTLSLMQGANATGITAGLSFGPAFLTGNAIIDTAANTKLTLGALSGTFNLIKQNGGQLVLASDSTRAGTMTLTAGTLLINSTSALGTAAVGLNITGGTLDLATNTSVAPYNVSVTGAATILTDRFTSGGGITHTLGALVLSATTLTVDDSATVTGGSPTLAFGALTLNNSGLATILTNAGVSTSLASVTTANANVARTLAISGSGNATISGTILPVSGSIALLKSGIGTLTLGSNDTLSGGTVTGGALLANSNGALGSTGTFAVNTGGTVVIGSGITISRALTFSSGATLAGFGTYSSTNAFSIASGVHLSPGLDGGLGTLTLSAGGTGVTLVSGSVLDVGIDAANADKLAVSGSLTIANGASVNFTQFTSPTAGRYVLLTSSAGSFSNNFTTIGLPSAYRLQMNGNQELDLVHRATLQVSTATPASATIITGGSTAFTFTVSNVAPSNSSDLGFAAASGTNTSGSISGPVAVSAGSTSGPQTLYFVGSTIGNQVGTFTVSDASATTTTVGGSVSVNVLGHANPSLNLTSVDFGNVHVGAVTDPSVILSNLGSNIAGLHILSNGGLSGISSGGTLSAGGTVSLSAHVDASTVGAYSQTYTLTSEDDPQYAGATGRANQVLSVTGNVYSGLGEWASAGSGDWNIFGNWSSSGGIPGVDGSILSAGDSAYFGPVIAGPSTVTLSGVSPQLSALTFNSTASYTIARAGDEHLELNHGGSPVAVSVTGSHTIAVPVSLSSNAVVNTGASGDSLTISGNVSGTGGLTKNGLGTLVLSGNNDFSGGATLNGGTLRVSSAGALGSTGTISFGGGTLQYSGANTDFSPRFSSAASQQFNIDTNGQSVTCAAGLTSSGGTLTKLGAGVLTLSGDNSGMTGLTTVSGGTLRVAGTLGSGGVTIVGGGALGGTGIIGGVTTIQSGGILNPNTPGTTGIIHLNDLTLLSGSKVQFDLTSLTDFDQVAFTGTANAADNGVTVEITLTSGATPFHVNDTFQLFSSGLGDVSLAHVYLPSGYVWDTDHLAQSGTLRVAALPEPGALILGMVALVPAGLALLRRRKMQLLKGRNK